MKLLSVDEAAAFLETSPEEIRRMAEDKTIPHIRQIEIGPMPAEVLIFPDEDLQRVRSRLVFKKAAPAQPELPLMNTEHVPKKKTVPKSKTS